MDEDTFNFLLGLVCGVIAILMFVGVTRGVLWDNIIKVEELGQAICEETLDMDFKRYSARELECQEKEDVIEKNYDGIIVIGENDPTTD